MNDTNRFILLERAVSRLRTVRTRTWLMLAAVALGFFGLLVWVAVAVLTWLWAEAPAMTEAGKRLADDAVTQFEQAGPGLKEELEQWAPGLKRQLGMPSHHREESATRLLPGWASRAVSAARRQQHSGAGCAGGASLSFPARPGQCLT